MQKSGFDCSQILLIAFPIAAILVEHVGSASLLSDDDNSDDTMDDDNDSEYFPEFNSRILQNETRCNQYCGTTCRLCHSKENEIRLSDGVSQYYEENITTLDFSSLYPSVIKSNSTILPHFIARLQFILFFYNIRLDSFRKR